ncbi:MAG: magnesium transporter [Nitrospinae bacterium CG11_big_fil_rev_8_21_14_0_20_45_15]|nr:MAG: magnesium transporter [Nitrospinae bacterium CG11_big_fil_rev_8_21_14_0_20_45_15]
MSGKANHAIDTLNRQFFIDHPSEAVEVLELLDPNVSAKILSCQQIYLVANILGFLSPDLAASVFSNFSDDVSKAVLENANPSLMTELLGKLEETERNRLLALVDTGIQNDFKTLMSYPEDSAGRLMETRFYVFRENMSVRHCLRRLRKQTHRPSRTLYLVNGQNKLVSRVEMQDFALAEPLQALSELAKPIKAFVNPTDPKEEVVEKMEIYKLSSLPVVDIHGGLIGVIRHDAFVKAAEEGASVDIQTMFGVGKDERALSKPMFAVKKRLPWLEINLLTAFLAASVVGLFEATIAKFTALAVLLPVVAGQSGNTGAQALAVTMRGLALKEISVRQWKAVVFKEMWVGFLNGVAVALTTALGVYFWSRSWGLSMVIGISMVISMVLAGLAGASVPIILTRLGQDPATASSIVLTTVTDVAGFFSFLGIATMLSYLL